MGWEGGRYCVGEGAKKGKREGRKRENGVRRRARGEERRVGGSKKESKR